MAISTSDVITPANTGDDTINNGNAIVHCTLGGLTKKITTYEHEQANYGFSGIETRLTNRFDEVAYYFTATGIDGGGA